MAKLHASARGKSYEVCQHHNRPRNRMPTKSQMQCSKDCMRVIWSSERDFSGRKFLSLPEESDNRFNGDMFTVSVVFRVPIFCRYYVERASLVVALCQPLNNKQIGLNYRLFLSSEGFTKGVENFRRSQVRPGFGLLGITCFTVIQESCFMLKLNSINKKI